MAARKKVGPTNLMGNTNRGIAPTRRRKAAPSPKARRIVRSK